MNIHLNSHKFVKMYLFYFLLSYFIVCAHPQKISNNLPSVAIDKNSLDDNIVQIFNDCKCVIFYLCDEENNIIPSTELANTLVTLNHSLRRIRRITCSNKFYYCCKNRTEIASPTTPSSTPIENTIASSTTTPLPKTIATPTYATALQDPQFSLIFSKTIAAPVQKKTFRCGKSSNTSSELTDLFPWTVAVTEKTRKFYLPQYISYTFRCSGALIHPKVVLTTQRCIQYIHRAHDLVVTAGNDTATSNFRRAKYVSKIIRHSQFLSSLLYNDIALLILKEPFTNVTPVCLPQPYQQFVGTRCVTTAWVYHDRWRTVFTKVYLPLVDSGTCLNLLRRVSGSDFRLHISALCAGAEEAGDLTCLGGGGPLMCRDDDDRYVQVGITSWGVRCGKKDVPGVYTDVAKFRGWIDGWFQRENLSFE